MSDILKISNEDIIYHLKISCQIPSLLEAIAARKVITETSEKVGITVEISELQESADRLRLANKLIKAEETWEWLQKHYLSLEALEIFYALQEGEISFQEIARQYIQNPEIRRAGGYQGIRKRSDFRPEIASLVFAANPPQILKPVITPKGAHIIIVEEIIEPELNEQMRVQIFDDLFTNWLKDQVNKLEIVATLGQSANFSSSPAEILSKAS